MNNTFILKLKNPNKTFALREMSSVPSTLSKETAP